MKLYELENAYLSLLQMIDDEELPEDALTDTLEAITGEVEVKADNVACMLKSIEADISAIKTEETRLAIRRQKKEKVYDRLKNYLSDTLQRMSIDKVETARNKITFRKSEKVEISEGFIKWAQANRDDLLSYAAPTANKTEIKKALKSGAEIVGAQLVSNKNIQIN